MTNSEIMKPNTLEEINQLPTILTILDMIAGEEEGFRQIEEKHQYFISYAGSEDKFELLSETPDEPCVLRPFSYCFNSYFRGQYEYFDDCVPTIYRIKVENSQNKKKDSIDQFIHRLRSSEFELLLRTHPFVKSVFNEGINLKDIGEIKLKVNYLGLAQHYELETDMLDFTNDKWVAAFFATNRKVGDRYSPIDSGSYGVVYRYCPPPEYFLRMNDDSKPDEKFSIIGLQPFKRPGEQKGFALKMENGENLNQIRGIQKFFFRHDKLAAEIIHNRMNQGNNLFPFDEIEALAQKIKGSKKISINAFKLAFEKYPVPQMDEIKLQEACIDKGIKFVNYPIVRFSKDTEKNFIKYWKNGGEKEFFSKIVFRRTLSVG